MKILQAESILLADPASPVDGLASEEPTSLCVWCVVQDQVAHVQPVASYFGDRAKFIYTAEWDPEQFARQRPDIVLCVNDYPYQIVRCIDMARSSGIPSLVLQDGVLEWRCQYENPLFGAGGGAPQHQPVLADKIACLGAQSARQIARWGNRDKVEVTGMPRLDYLLNRPVPPLRSPGNRLLVMTAKNPGFTPEQAAVTLRSLVDVQSHLARLPGIEVQWRINKGIAQQLGVANELRQTASEELVALVERVDAVITTPSTAVLESMLLNRPVAALDYHNVPRFVPTAWTISAPEHIRPVIDSLLHPPANKLAFQRDCLADCLACDGPAARRVAVLMEKMVALAKRWNGTAHGHFPRDLLGPIATTSAPDNPSLAELYPTQSVFGVNDVSSLQVRLARLEKEQERLLNDLKQQGIGYGIRKLGRYVAEYLRSRTTAPRGRTNSNGSR